MITRDRSKPAEDIVISFSFTTHYCWDGQEFTFLQFLQNKAVGNKDEKYLKERRIFLEKFIRVLGTEEFIVHSDEFKIFSRQTGDVKKVLKLLPKLTSTQLLERYQSWLGFSDSPDNSKIKSWNSEINEFGAFIKKADALLKDMREKVKDMVQTWDKANQHYKDLSQHLAKYESHNLNHYWDSLHSRYPYFKVSQWLSIYEIHIYLSCVFNNIKSWRF